MRVLNDEYKRPCPICGTPIHAGLLLCRDDWLRVPVELQREVSQSWRAVNKHSASSIEESRARAVRYRLAAQAAIEAAKARSA